MSSAKSIVATSFLSAVLVIGAAAPLAYFGYEKLAPHMQPRDADVPSVVMDLKEETVKQVREITDQASASLQRQLNEQSAQQAESIASLKGTVQRIAEQQKELAAMLAEQTNEAAPVKATDVPGAREDAFNQTVFFPLGVVKSADTDKQLATVVLNARNHAKNQECRTNVLGFSDTLGNDASNLRLSQKRAEHVAAKLVAAGFEVDDVKGWGERWLNVHTVDGVKNEKNRRVVVEMTCSGPTRMAAAPAS